MSVFATGFDGATRFAGTIGKRYRSVAADYTVSQAEDYFIDVNATAALRTITLPPAAKCFSDGCGMVFFIRNSTGTNNVVIEGDGAETINGAANITLGSQYSNAVLQSTGSAWVSMSNAAVAATDLTLTGALVVEGTTNLQGAVTADDAVTVSGTLTASVPAVMDDVACVDLAATGDVDLSGANSLLLLTDSVDPGDTLAIDDASPAEDAALELTRAHHMHLIRLNSAAGAKAITTDTAGAGAVESGQVVMFHAETVGGGSYTLAVQGGDLTFDAADEAAIVVRSGSAWVVLSLQGATIV